MKKLLLTTLCCAALLTSRAQGQRFTYDGPDLRLTPTEVSDPLATITAAMIPECDPANKTAIRNATPMTQKLWKLALRDIESNIVQDKGTKYFGAGRVFGMTVFTRDICFSGIFGLNELYPDIMLSSLKYTRDLRLKLALYTPKDFAAWEIKGDWKEDTIGMGEYVKRYHTHPFTRRTDDVVWVWAACDLIEKNPAMADQWQWLYDTTHECFKKMYDPFFDPSDGLYRGQASFIDIHEGEKRTTAYPQDYHMFDCILLKSTSTNCLYYQAMKSMEKACKKLGKHKEAKEWKKRGEALRKAIVKNLRFPDGSFAYYKDKYGVLEERREALGAALTVLTGVVEGKDAVKALEGYPVIWAGVQLLYPFYPWRSVYHNNTAWPFVDTFFLWAKEIAEKKDYTDQNAALLARVTKGGSFREIVNWHTKQPDRSHSQLWTAAGFVNVCFRAGIVETEKKSR